MKKPTFSFQNTLSQKPENPKNYMSKMQALLGFCTFVTNCKSMSSQALRVVINPCGLPAALGCFSHDIKICRCVLPHRMLADTPSTHWLHVPPVSLGRHGCLTTQDMHKLKHWENKYKQLERLTCSYWLGPFSKTQTRKHKNKHANKQTSKQHKQ